MNQHSVFRSGLVWLALTLAAPLGAQTRQEAVPATPLTTPEGKAANNHIFAQQVVNEIMADNPDILAFALHSSLPGEKPGTPAQFCVASSMDLIGLKDEPGDVAVAAKDQLNIGLAPLGKITRLKVAVAFRSAAGQILGFCMISFPSKVDKLTAHARTLAILEILARKFPDQASLFKPVA